MRKIYFIILILLAATQLPAEEKNKETLAAATLVIGDCFYERDGKTKKIFPKTIFHQSDRLFTKKGKLDIQLGPDAVVHLSPYTSLVLKDLTEKGVDSIIQVDLQTGRTFTKIVKKLKPNSQFSIKSPSAVAAVRGTEFVISEDPENEPKHEDAEIPSGVFVNEGEVAVTQVTDGQEPSTPVVVSKYEQVLTKSDELQKTLMDDFMKRKMKIFKVLDVMTEKQYELMKKQKDKQIELLEKVKGSSGFDKLKEKQNELLDRNK